MDDAPMSPPSPEGGDRSERRLRRQRRQERIARQKIQEEMEAAALAAAAEQARNEGRKPQEQQGRIEPEVEAQPQAREDGATALARIEPTQVEARGGGQPPAQPPGDAYEVARAARQVRMKEIRRELRRRRRMRGLGILLRFMIFVILPTAFIGWYYYEKATDMYVSKSALIFKSGGAAAAAGGAGLFNFGGFSNLTESVSVQEYIQSQDILRRLNEDHGYFEHFQSEEIDEFHRLAPDATIDDAHKYFVGGLLRSGKVEVSFDTAEGIIRLEVVGATPEASQRFSQAIIAYSEELVNKLNERSQNDGVRTAERKVAEARDELLRTQRRVAEVQEQLNIFSVETEATVLQSRIATLETEIDAIVAEIEKLKTVAKNPNDSRYVPLRLDLEVKTKQLRDLRGRLTGSETADRPSMARLSSELELARVEQATANLLYTSSLSTLETAVQTASSQSLYLETVVQPGLPENASKPERLTNTALAFLILFATYILGILTISLIREQAAI